MATKVMSLRLPDDLREWVIAYAGERGVSQAVVISAAVREFRETCAAGVPELEEPSAERVQAERVATRERPAAASTPLAAPRAPVRKAVIAPLEPSRANDERVAALQARQAKLNDAKYGRKR